VWETYVILGLGYSVSAWLVVRKQRLTLRGWKAAVESLGLLVEETSGSWGGSLRLRAREGPIQVRIFPSPGRGHPPQIVIAAPWPLGFSDIRIRPEGDKPAGARELEIGDERFDQAFYVVGPAQLLFALLDAETRRLMIAFPENALRIGGELRAEAKDLSLADTLRLLLDLARRFTQPLEVVQRVARNAREDSSSEVRLRNLLHLIRELPGEAVTTEALRAACADPSPKVRLRAAKVLGAETHGILIELAASPEDDDASAQALAILGRGLPLERTREILGQALRRRLLKTARACLEALGGSGAAADVDILAKVLAREKSDLAAAAAQALGASGNPAAGNPAAEPHLLPALQHARPDVRVAAAKALGRAGTAAAVLPLKEAAEHAHDQELRSATRQAIAEIQSRLQGASPGQLSLAGADVGKLSLAETEAGQLSLADDRGGQLSISAEERE
jgi:HEAT repeat protein